MSKKVNLQEDKIVVETRGLVDSLDLVRKRRIKSDPKIKVSYLEKEIQRLEKELREKLRRSNVEYTEAGDGWHDNAIWDALMDEVKVLQARIREIKKELVEIKWGRIDPWKNLF